MSRGGVSAAMRAPLIGVLGGGQLGRMLGLAALPLGARLRFFDRAADAVAGAVGELHVGTCEDAGLLDRFVAGLTICTYEFENVPLETVQRLARHVPVYPPPSALAVAQDRLPEKQLFQRLSIPTAKFAAVDSREGLETALHEVGTPAVLKTRRFGYDGKGQARLASPADADAAWAALGGVPLILEEFIRFDREVSMVAARSTRGEEVFYPLVENHHDHHVLARTIAPAPDTTPALQQRAIDKTRAVLDALAYVGVLAIEFFQVGERLLANEMAPRVHNSGHWTIDGAQTSQFENHIRAVLGWPLGPATLREPTVMFNLIGEEPDPLALAALPRAKLHRYGKQARPGRKLAHVNVLGAADSLATRQVGELVRQSNHFIEIE